MQREFLNGFHRILPRENVHRILHRVCGQNFLIVAFRMRGLKVAFKAEANGQLLNIVPALLLYYAEQPNAGLTVVVCAQLDGHPSAPAIRGISEWTQQQRNMVVLFRVSNLEYDRNYWIKSLHPARFEIG